MIGDLLFYQLVEPISNISDGASINYVHSQWIYPLLISRYIHYFSSSYSSVNVQQLNILLICLFVIDGYVMYADLSTCDSPRCAVMFYYRMAFKLTWIRMQGLTLVTKQHINMTNS